MYFFESSDLIYNWKKIHLTVSCVVFKWLYLRFQSLISMKYFPVLIIVLFFISCSEPPDTVKDIIRHSGQNRKELQKVIDHYKGTHERKKLKAAYFIIENLPYHESYYDKRFQYFDKIFEQLDTINKARANQIWDSLEKVYGVFNTYNINSVSDLYVIKADYLIENIDLAFEVWKKNPWGLKLSEEMFYEYILPYRTQDEHLTRWREGLIQQFSWLEDSLKSNSDFLESYSQINQYVNSFLRREDEEFLRYPISIDYNNMLKGKTGSCSDEANLFSWILRANGLPAAIDYTPQWANRGSGHIWHVLLDEKEVPYTIFKKHRGNFWGAYKEKLVPKPNNPVGASEFYVLSPGDSLIPDNVILYDKKKVSKVYRKMFSVHNPYFKDPELYGAFRSPLINDVTNQYVNCADVTIHIPFKLKAKFAYLCTFDISGWNPVAFTAVEEGEAVFKDVGSNVLYLPVLIHDNKILPIESPFVLSEEGEKNSIVLSGNKKSEIRIDRKYPLFGNILNYMNYLYGGVFEGANSPDFNDAETLSTIDRTPYYATTFRCKNERGFRYFRFRADSNRFSDMAEMEVFQEINGNVKKINGVTIGVEGDFGHELAKAFDGDLNTYYGKDKANSWIGLDFGVPKKVTEIKICPRNDTDIILPGLVYELFFWNNKTWVSLGKKEATSNYLKYNNAPENALFWLHCHSGGKEERPFTYNNDKQIWW